MRFPVLRSATVPVAVGTIAGAFVIAGLTLGYYSWTLFAVAVVVGLAAGIPIGLWSARRMRAMPPITRPASPTMDPEASQRVAHPRAGVPYPPALAQEKS